MADDFSIEPMLDMYIFETTQNIDNLEKCVLDTEKTSCYTQETINEIFRNMHTIKGSSAMMMFNNISTPAHTIEDLFYYIREKKPENVDYSIVSDLVLEGIDFIKMELEKIKDGEKADGDPAALTSKINEYLLFLKEDSSDPEPPKPKTSSPQQYYIASEKLPVNHNSNTFKATLFFQDDCEMENIRAFGILHNLLEITNEVYSIPEDVIDNEDSINIIRADGLQIYFKVDKSLQDMQQFFDDILFLKKIELVQLDSDFDIKQHEKPKQVIIEETPVIVPKLVEQHDQKAKVKEHEKDSQVSSAQSIISVNVAKLDKLMDLVGEMVIAEAMVIHNNDLKGLEIENFYKASRQLHKINNEIRDMVMSIRMVPLSLTFQKMHRIVRDMSKKLEKEVHLHLVGEETEIDKNIIEHISDPLMHLVRNSIDHGIESVEQRETAGKSKCGNITLEAKNAGSEVIITVRDDGKGLNKQKILEKAKENGILTKPESEMCDREIYNLICLPGFSTKENITEFSGRGVGMDVVTQNIEQVGGTVSIESAEGIGSSVIMRIPLTLAIIDGMNIKVGNSRFTIPITSIKESFRPEENDVIKDPNDKEMIMVRGQCYPILRLHEHYCIKTDITDFTQGILIMIEQDEKLICIFADELIGQQQVVVKSLPNYIKNSKKIEGITGCTLLADGSTSLIFDVGGLIALKN